MADTRSRDLVLAGVLAVAASLVVNDSATYELAGGVAVVASLSRVQLAPATWRGSGSPVPVLGTAVVRAEDSVS
jgi:hypothetical protein